MTINTSSGPFDLELLERLASLSGASPNYHFVKKDLSLVELSSFDSFCKICCCCCFCGEETSFEKEAVGYLKSLRGMIHEIAASQRTEDLRQKLTTLYDDAVRNFSTQFMKTTVTQFHQLVEVQPRSTTPAISAPTAPTSPSPITTTQEESQKTAQAMHVAPPRSHSAATIVPAIEEEVPVSPPPIIILTPVADNPAQQQQG
jgi:hypothetical protein